MKNGIRGRTLSIKHLPSFGVGRISPDRPSLRLQGAAIRANPTERRNAYRLMSRMCLNSLWTCASVNEMPYGGGIQRGRFLSNASAGSRMTKYFKNGVRSLLSATCPI